MEDSLTVACYPLDAVTGSPEYTGRMLRETISALVGGASTARPLGAFSGVRPGTPSTTVALAGFNWTCEPHSGILDVQAAAEAGPYFYAVTADETGTLNAAHASLVRTDLLVVTLSDPAESDGSSVPEAEVVYTPGTAGAGTPATPARSMVIARFNVPQSGGGSPTVTWVAPTLFAAGAKPVVATQAALADLDDVAFEGLEATVLATPGATWRFTSSVWVMHGVAKFASAAARNAAITSPAAGMSTEVAGLPFEHNGTSWQKKGLHKPTAAAGTSGTTTINDDGSITLTGVTNVILTNAFAASSLYGTETFEIEISGSMSVAGQVFMRLAASGVVDPSAANHDVKGQQWTQAGVASAVTVLNNSEWWIQNVTNSIRHEARIEMRHAAQAVATRGIYDWTNVVTLGTAENKIAADLTHRGSTAFDGFQLRFTQAFTGTIKIRPRP